jgi:pSer/pThr/pTyr-binding forkhead associated (FHA) protein
VFDQRFLQDGDEVTLGDVLIRFNISKTKFRQMPRQKIEVTQKTQTT